MSDTEPDILTISAMARIYGVHRATISDLAIAWRLPFHPVKTVGKGLDREARCVICLALNRKPEAAAS